MHTTRFELVEPSVAGAVSGALRIDETASSAPHHLRSRSAPQGAAWSLSQRGKASCLVILNVAADVRKPCLCDAGNAARCVSACVRACVDCVRACVRSCIRSFVRACMQ
eukprot:6181611-Pleurochrysis_carterae.AAC.1